MYKVLIIDDEVLVRVGLKTTIDWEEIGFSVVAEASNGEQGYEKYIQHSPHAIITDIKMPKKDGLWLIEKIRQKNQDVRIIVLTCFDEFAYVQKALRLGADDYILKSEIEDEELIEIMKKTKHKLISSHESSNPKNEMNIKDIKRFFMEDLVKNEFVFDEKILSKCSDLSFPIANTKFSIAVVAFDNEIMWEEGSQVSNAIGNIISDQLLEKDMDFIMNREQNEYLILMSSDKLNTNELKTIFKLIGNAANQYFGQTLNIVYTKVYTLVDELSEAYGHLKNKSQILFYSNHKNNLIMNTNEIEFNHINVFELGKRYNRCFKERIAKRDYEGVAQLLEETYDYFEKNKVKPKLTKIFYSNLLGEIFNMFEHLINGNAIQPYEYYHEKIGRAYNIKQIFSIILDLSEKIIFKIQNSNVNHSKLIMKKTIDFINKNYDDKISLEDVAEAVNLSKHYLCSIFKRETGENMSLYINKLRIEKSKIMLLKPDCKVKDIFDSVGFSNQQYFSKVFKKITGMTIMQYKESHNK
ncbi:MAG: response regulator [Clostridia bacterium]|nr:response regulator [Clostridia bacterium]